VRLRAFESGPGEDAGARGEAEQLCLEQLWRILGGTAQAPPWPRVDRVLGEHGIRRDSAAGRREFEKRLEWRRASGLNEFDAPAVWGQAE